MFFFQEHLSHITILYLDLVLEKCCEKRHSMILKLLKERGVGI